MNSTFSTSLPSSPLQQTLSPLQVKVITKLRETTNIITKDILSVLIASKSISVEKFIEKYVPKKSSRLSSVNLRAKEFSERLLDVVDEDLDKIPSLTRSFELLAAHAKDPIIRRKLISEIAFSSIQDLIAEFDRINPSLINDINAYYHKDKSPCFSILKRPSQYKWPSCQRLAKVALVIGLAGIAMGCVYYRIQPMPPKIPYNLKAANKIRSELQEHFTKHFERPEVTEKDSFTRQLSCEKLTYTYETRINIPYKNTVLREDESNFLNKIDSLMNRECCFFVTCNTLRDKHIENVVMTLKVESPCKVNSTIS